MRSLLLILGALLLVAPPDPPPALRWPSCPAPECQEQDGSNIRLCGLHDYGDGLVLEWADGISSFFVCLDGPVIAVEAWTDRDAYRLGEPPVMTWTPQNEFRPYCAGYAIADPMVVTRLVGHVSVVEDVIYTE